MFVLLILTIVFAFAMPIAIVATADPVIRFAGATRAQRVRAARITRVPAQHLPRPPTV